MNIGKAFINQTSLKKNGPSLRSLGKLKPNLVLENSTLSLIALPPVSNLEVQNMDLRQAIEQRESVREYRNESIRLEELSYLLWCSQGIKRIIPDIVTLRNVPSAGGRHAYETFLLINHVEGLEAGLYHYHATTHQLEVVKIDDILSHQLKDAFDEQDHVLESAVTFIWVAVPNRMTWSYGERGYRYLLIDVGHICQNIYLSAQQVNCGTCAVAHFDDDIVNSLLNLNTDEQFVVYAATVGKH